MRDGLSLSANSEDQMRVIFGLGQSFGLGIASNFGFAWSYLKGIGLASGFCLNLCPNRGVGED